MKKTEFYKFIIEKLEDNIHNKGEEVNMECTALRSMYNKERWKTEFTIAEKKAFRKATLGTLGKQGLQQEDALWQYGNRLIDIYDKIERILAQLGINEDNYETADFHLVRLAGLLLWERDLIDEHASAREHRHISPHAFDALFLVIPQKRPELELKEFHRIYKEMWNYFPYKIIESRKQELLNKLQASVDQQNFSKEWLNKELPEDEIGKVELQFFVDKMFKELFNIWWV